MLLERLVMPDFDAIIIGTGQAGPSLAIRLAGAGMKVAVVERHLVGGTCVSTGYTPTKALVASAYAARVARRAAEYGVVIGGDVGEIVAANLLDHDPRRVSERITAYTLYTDPPLARVGMSLAEALATETAAICGPRRTPGNPRLAQLPTATGATVIRQLRGQYHSQNGQSAF
jgi:pyruvate/2-oxoglutarate dehydrogenase complex dihydrolipoamide dehydrogenase (E3) component